MVQIKMPSDFRSMVQITLHILNKLYLEKFSWIMDRWWSK